MKLPCPLLSTSSSHPSDVFWRATNDAHNPVGGFLIVYATYSMLKPESLHVCAKSSWLASSLVGLAGGVIGGFTAFPGATVVVWSGLRRLPKRESRSIVQPYILGMQLVSLAMLAVKHPRLSTGPTGRCW